MLCLAPLDVKLASGLNRGLQWTVFAATGTSVFINAISNAEGDFNSNAIDEATRDQIIASEGAKITTQQLSLFGFIIIGTILVCTIAAYCLMRFGFKVDDKMEETIVKELEERHKKDEAQAQKAA